MGISFGSIGTGLPKDIVQQIIAAEKIPIEKMEGRKSKFVDKQVLVGQLMDLVKNVGKNLATNANARSLRELKYETRTDLIDVILDKNIANPGTYSLEVSQMAQKSTAMSSGFEDKDESYIGVGFIQYTLPNGENKEIYIDSDNSSLSGIAKLINSDTENGMSAKVVNDGRGTDEPWRIIISIDGTGAEKTADFPYFYFIDGDQDFYLEEQRPAQNAIIKLDGFEIEIPTNTTTDLIPGATLDLKKAAPGEEFQLVITEDSQAVTEKVKELVASLNDVLSFIKQQNTLDANTDTTRTLGGDITLQSLESRFRTAIFKDIGTTYGPKRFGDLGVEFQRDGSVKLDDQKFEHLLSQNYDLVSQVLRGRFTEDGEKEYGFMDYLTETTDRTLRRPDGLLQSRKNSLQSSIDQIDRRIVNKQRMINQKEKNLKMKFARLEGTISRIQRSGAGLASLGASSANPVQQL